MTSVRLGIVRSAEERGADAVWVQDGFSEALERERPSPRQRARRTQETLSALKQGARASIEIAGFTDPRLHRAVG
ncbi:MAG: hypothetical protein WD646_05695 [Actinomycetota bacterium]